MKKDSIKDVVKKDIIKEKRISYYTVDTTYNIWYDKNRIIELCFRENFVIYWYYGQCIYYYFINNYKDTIDLLWSYKIDCIQDMNMLNKSHGLKKHPKYGDVFASYTLVNDITIKVIYNFPEWVKKINKIEKDTLYPDYFYFYKDVNYPLKNL